MNLKKILSVVEKLFYGFVFIVILWAVFFNYNDGRVIDHVTGTISGHIICDASCQESIGIESDKAHPKKVVLEASRRFIGCNYFTSTGTTDRNYWTDDWQYELIGEYSDNENLGNLHAGMPRITRDWASYLPIWEIPYAVCPERLDAQVHFKADHPHTKMAWPEPYFPDTFIAKLDDEKDWFTEPLWYSRWRAEVKARKLAEK